MDGGRRRAAGTAVRRYRRRGSHRHGRSLRPAYAATGNEFQGQIRIDAAQSPGHLDFVHDDGLLWEAIYVAQPDFFRLNYVEADAGTARPTLFATTADTPGTVIVMQR